MALLPSGLNTADHGVQGWNAIYSDNFELIDSIFVNMFLAAQIPGSQAIAAETTTQTDPAAATAAALTDSTTGTATQIINDVTASFNQTILNDNFASLVDEINKLITDIADIRTVLEGNIDYSDALKTKINDLLVKLRKTTGVGILSG
jgi:hypothetical protein